MGIHWNLYPIPGTLLARSNIVNGQCDQDLLCKCPLLLSFGLRRITKPFRTVLGHIGDTIAIYILEFSSIINVK